jgi:peptide/nickel transport system substrate-binding protein
MVTDQRPQYGEAPVPGGTLRLTLVRPIAVDFNPAAFAQDYQVAASYLDPLVWVDEVTMEPRPWLAESWEWNDDGTEITYALRRDVRWHDGSPLTADDVRFSLYVYRDDANSAVRNFFAPMREAEVLDELRLRVRLNDPTGGWIFNASNQFVFQRAQFATHWSDQAAGERTLSTYDWASGPLIGTGPWRLTERRDRRLAFARNDDYWAGPPNFDGLELSVFESPEARLERWREGFAELVWLSAPSEVEAVRDEAGTLYVADAAEVMFAAFNFVNPARTAPLFEDVRVRLALSVALDRQRYADEVFGGFVQVEPAGTIAQPWALDPGIVNPPRNLVAARQLLTNAGWLDRDGDGRLEDADGRPLRLVAILRSDSRPELAAVLDRVAADLGEVGVELEVQSLDPVAFQQRWTVARDYDLIAFAYSLYAGFTDFDLYGSAWDIRFNPQGFNPGAYGNPVADEAIAAALRAPDVPTQRRALRDLQRAVNDDLFGLWFGFPKDLILVRPDILGYQPNKMWQTWDTRKLWRRGGS